MKTKTPFVLPDYIAEEVSNEIIIRELREALNKKREEYEEAILALQDVHESLASTQSWCDALVEELRLVREKEQNKLWNRIISYFTRAKDRLSNRGNREIATA